MPGDEDGVGTTLVLLGRGVRGYDVTLDDHPGFQGRRDVSVLGDVGYLVFRAYGGPSSAPVGQDAVLAQDLATQTRFRGI